MQIPTDFPSSLGGKITLQEDREESEKLYAQVAFFFGEVVPRGRDLIERKQQLIIGHEKKNDVQTCWLYW